ncbi:MAG: Cof-type HAD-IIB family hydrolase [Eubacteriales bacterium]
MHQKTLYISDLDGTLLKSDATLAGETKDRLNNLIKQGMHFTAATARTSASVIHILDGLNINVPCILMNGVCLYDLNELRYISAEKIKPHAAERLIEVIHRLGLSGFMFSVKDNELYCCYENTSSPNAEGFIEERVRKYGKRFILVPDFYDFGIDDVVYYSLSDTEEKLRAVYDTLTKDESLRLEFYRDVYNEDFWYLEVCAAGVSKSHALKKLRDLYCFDKVVCFGDNINDLPMFESSDECYAVANAREEVKQAATAVIKSNTEKGVIEWLEQNFKS